MSDLVGRTFGGWLVQRPLSHSGRGALYEATRASAGRAAIRFIEAPDQVEVHRCEAEYELLRSLKDDHLVKAYDFGVAEIGSSRLAHLVMEFSKGAPLATLVDQGALPARKAARFGTQVASALAAVHGKGIAHLDIKPANILIHGETAKLVGFGTAQRVGALYSAFAGRAAAYEAPEQRDTHAPVACSADIYALGATLFELLTGAPYHNVAAEVISLQPLTTLGTLGKHKVPGDLATLVARMLAADPARRPEASEVARVLSELSDRAELGERTDSDRQTCPRCSASVPIYWKFCGSCGFEMSPTDRGPAPTVIASARHSMGSEPPSRGTPPRVPGTDVGGLPGRDSLPGYGGPPIMPQHGGPLPGVPGPSAFGAKEAPSAHQPPDDGPRLQPTVGRDEGAERAARTKGPVVFLDGDEDASPQPEAESSAEASSLHWNISFPGNDAVIASRILITGVTYPLETALQTLRAAHSFSQASVGAKELLGDSTDVPVKFVVEAKGARVRAPGGRDWLASVASEGLTCRANGTDVFRAEVLASDAGPVAITVTFSVRAAITLRETISLDAVGKPSARPAGEAPAPHGEGESEAMEASPAAIQAVPEATLVLQLEPFERWYAIKIAAGGVEDSAVLRTAVTTPELAKEAVAARKKLVALSRRYHAEPAADGDRLSGLRPTDRGEALLEVARIGRRLHGLLFGEPEENVPDDLMRVAGLIREHGRDAAVAPRMQIDAETLPFPWGIVYDAAGPLDQVSDVDLHGFWGRRFAIDRAISAILRTLPPPTLDGAIQPCWNPHLDSEEKLQVVARQRGYFQQIGSDFSVRPAIESGEQLRAYLQDEGITAPSILYFFCHARAAHEMSEQLFQIAAAADEQATLMLDPSGSKGELSVSDLKQLRRKPLKAKPLVFLNACSSAEADQYYQSQFLTLFVSQWQARAFIGSDWKIPAEFADAFARRALDRFFGRDPEQPRLALGAALHATVAEVLELKNPFSLIYALYGRPELLAA